MIDCCIRVVTIWEVQEVDVLEEFVGGSILLFEEDRENGLLGFIALCDGLVVNLDFESELLASDSVF